MGARDWEAVGFLVYGRPGLCEFRGLPVFSERGFVEPAIRLDSDVTNLPG